MRSSSVVTRMRSVSPLALPLGSGGYNFRIMLKWLVIAALVPVVFAATQKPLPMNGSQQQGYPHPHPDTTQSPTPPCTSEVTNENVANVEGYAFYKAHPKEYLKAAIAPANLSNWILATLGVIGGILALFTLRTFRRQTDHIVTSERAWMVASMKIGPENPLIFHGTATVPVKAECILKNKGNTPAFIIETGIAIHVIGKDDLLPDSPPPYDPKYVAKWDGRGIPISPKMSFLRLVFKDVQDPINILNGSAVLCVYGYVKYRDVFRPKQLFRRNIHETRYCFRYIPGQPQFGMSAQFLIEGDSAYVHAT